MLACMNRQLLSGLGLSACIASAAFAADPIQLKFPLDCEIGRTCVIQQYVDHDPSPNAKDYMCGTLTYEKHDGTDFRLPTTAAQRAGVNVLAAADGEVLGARDGMPDIPISTVGAPSVAGRECGNGALISHGDGWQTQYCHLAQGSVLVKKGDRVTAGQPIGRVGLSGNTVFPHLHLTVRRNGQVVDPFAFGASEGSCGKGTSLWSAADRDRLAYRERQVLNVGFAAGPVTMPQIEEGEAGRTPPTASSEALVAFVRAIGLKGEDVQRLSIKGPDGKLIADVVDKPLDRDKAQYMIFTGSRRPPSGWAPGAYRATYTVTRAGQVVLEHSFALSL